MTNFTRLLTLERLAIKSVLNENLESDYDILIEIDELEDKLLRELDSPEREIYERKAVRQTKKIEKKAVSVIENAFLNALYNPRTSLGYKKVNSLYDECFGAAP